MPKKIKYVKVLEDCYEVYENGHYIGDVYKWWSRAGGAGWRCTGGNILGVRTRKAATNMLIRLKGV
jgi:hypothetical protein